MRLAFDRIELKYEDPVYLLLTRARLEWLPAVAIGRGIERIEVFVMYMRNRSEGLWLARSSNLSTSGLATQRHPPHKILTKEAIL